MMEQGQYNDKDSEISLHACRDNLLYPNVRSLQEELFPITTPRKSYSAENYLNSPSYVKNSGHSLRTDDADAPSKPGSADTYVKARDSKELFTRDFTLSDHVDQPPRWPTECQVLDERVKHIPFKPCPPESYYVVSGNEVQPKPCGEEDGIIVYQYYPISAVNYFCRSSVGGSKYLLPTCPSPEEDGLRFESRFESGNLAKAIKITALYYELHLRTDLYTNRHMQWYYFRITRMRKNTAYRFSIVNLIKGESLYTEGMRPLMYSVTDAQVHCVGWRRCGYNIAYFSNDNGTPEDPDQIQYNTLTFTVEFPHDDDTVYLAHSYPYTYSDLQDYLLEIVAHPIKSTYTTLRLLCKTLAGNNVYYLTITTPPSEDTPNKKKKAIVLTARVHPGETPASWMMHGFLEFLTGDTAPAKELRDHFIFKLVPMLNPDGVIVGNNRCSLTGKDLNRQYRTVIRESYPSIWYTKLMIRRLLEECGVAMYCDLHAHSKKHNIFMFGCENRRPVERKLIEQVFPLMLHKNASEKFSFENCKFRIQKCKEGTGRVVMWMMGIGNSFTMEASFGGATLGTKGDTHFNTNDYEHMGKVFCETLLDFYDEDPRKERLRTKILIRLMKEGSCADEPANIKLSDYSSDGGDTTSESDEETPERIQRIIRVPSGPPPPTPTKVKRYLMPKLNVQKLYSPVRRPLEANKKRRYNVCKANLTFTGSRQSKTTLSNGSSSDSDSENEPRKMKKGMRKKKKKKKKKGPPKRNELSESDYQLVKDYAIVDILPDGSFINLSKREMPRLPSYNRRATQQRLVDVQARLVSLRNKMWYGIGDVNPHIPLSWSKKSDINKKSIEKRKSGKKSQKPKAEFKNNIKETIRRQTTVELTPIGKNSKLRKSKSLSESTKESKQNKGSKPNTNSKVAQEEEESRSIAKNKTNKKPKTAKPIRKPM